MWLRKAETEPADLLYAVENLLNRGRAKSGFLQLTEGSGGTREAGQLLVCKEALFAGGFLPFFFVSSSVWRKVSQYLQSGSEQ